MTSMSVSLASTTTDCFCFASPSAVWHHSLSEGLTGMLQTCDSCDQEDNKHFCYAHLIEMHSGHYIPFNYGQKLCMDQKLQLDVDARDLWLRAHCSNH